MFFVDKNDFHLKKFLFFDFLFFTLQMNMVLNYSKIKISLLSLLLVVSFGIKAQYKSELPFSIYANGNYAVTYFDFNTPNAYFIEAGVRFNLFDGLQIGLQGTRHNFEKSFTTETAPIYAYTTTLTGIEFDVIYEFKVGKKLFIGPGIGLNFSKYYNTFTTNAATFVVDLPKPIYIYRYFFNARYPLGNIIDLQFGASINEAQSKYLDGIQTQKNFATDIFFGAHVGVLYHVGAKANKRRFSKSRKLRCPRFF